VERLASVPEQECGRNKHLRPANISGKNKTTTQECKVGRRFEGGRGVKVTFFKFFSSMLILILYNFVLS
jgi:hypothetical protein